MMNLSFHVNCYWLIHKFQGFLKPLQIINQQIKDYQKLNSIKQDNHKDF